MKPIHALAVAALSFHVPAAAAQEEPARYLRLVEDDGGARLRLELAARTFEPTSGEGPSVNLVSVMHIGDAAYYDELQVLLDAHDVVLFERVQPRDPAADALGDLPAAEASRVLATRRRLRHLAVAVERHRADTGHYPETASALLASLEGRAARSADRAARDAWDARIYYTAEFASGAEHPSSFTLRSLGADGQPGGDGAAADLAFADQPPLHPSELGEGGGMQKDIADALGLVFQLDAIDYNGAQWRNSDMSLEELSEAMGSAAGSDELFDVLDGSSLFTGLATGLLKLIGRTRSGSGMLKIMGIEILARADELLDQAPGEMGEMFDVLIRQRNRIVVEDLERLLADEGDVGSVAIFYGAGHMLDLERSLTGELGYAPAEETWHTGVSVDVAHTGLSTRRVASMRKMIADILDGGMPSFPFGG